MVSKMRSDREGAQLQCTLLNWALANHFGLEWLAAYPQPKKLGQLTRHLGLPAIRNLDEFHRMKQVTINRVNDGTEATIRAVEPNSLIVQNDQNLHGWMNIRAAQSQQKASIWFTPDLVTSMRARMAPTNASHFDCVDCLKIAVHVRRGDVGYKGGQSFRYLDDIYYTTILKAIREIMPNRTIQTHIFSESRGFSHPKNFDEANCTVHLDDHDHWLVWSHFIDADIFIMSKSSFSWVSVEIPLVSALDTDVSL